MEKQQKDKKTKAQKKKTKWSIKKGMGLLQNNSCAWANDFFLLIRTRQPVACPFYFEKKVMSHMIENIGSTSA